MVLQGFNAAEKTTAEFIEFCERLEMTEPESEMADDRIPKKKQSSVSEKKQGVTKRKRGDEKSGEGDCILHGENCGHTSHDCHTLKRLAKKTKDDWNQKGPKKKEDLQTMIAESFTIAVKNMKKKKNENEKGKEKPKVEFDLNMLENLNMSDSEVEEGELPNLTDESSSS